jgi:hypothetical protein
MGFRHVLKAVAPVAALAIAGSLAGCDKADVSWNGKQGVPLAQLDLSGEAPSEVTLLGPDTVDIRDGEKLSIEVEGSDEARERLRFVLANGSLGILRKHSEWSGGDGNAATVIITMPAPAKLTLAGSGKMTAASVSDHPDATMAGSGVLSLSSVNARALTVSIAGSGTLKAVGTTDSLDLNLMGSGTADLAGLKAGKAHVHVMGSGGATFASDGDVDAQIMGSGNVTVRGRARCTVKSMGSGKLVCEDGDQTSGKAA